MNRIIFLTIILLAIVANPGYAQKNVVPVHTGMGKVQVNAQGSAAETPEGMEALQISDGHRLLVPKGAQVTRKDGVISVESTSEFLLRKVTDLESKLKDLEGMIQELEDKQSKTLQEQGFDENINASMLKQDIEKLKAESQKGRLEITAELRALDAAIRKLSQMFEFSQQTKTPQEEQPSPKK